MKGTPTIERTHSQITTHLLKLSGLEGKGERHWSLLVIHAHTKHNSQAAKLIVDWEGKEKGIGHFQSYMYT